MLSVKSKRKGRWRIFVIFFVVVSASILTVFYLQTFTSATTEDWLTTREIVLEEQPAIRETPKDPNCTQQNIQLHPLQFFVMPDSPTPMCVYDMGDWKYALTDEKFENWFLYDYFARSFVFSAGDDPQMYKVINMTDHMYPIFIPNSKSIAKRIGTDFPGAEGLKIYKNILERLTPTDNDAYVADLDEPDFIFKRSDGFVQPIGNIFTSSNGKWLVFEAINIGFVRLNLETYEMKRFTEATDIRTAGFKQQVRLSISDDGKTVVSASYDAPFMVYAISDTCGDQKLAFAYDSAAEMTNPCPSRDLGKLIASQYPSYTGVNDVSLKYDTAEMHIHAGIATPQNPFKSGRYIMRMKNAPPTPKLDYLALGDSYSSGEGDTEWDRSGKKSYLPGTDNNGDDLTPREKCHISSRSYPFLLRDAMNIMDDRMKSVACSGATIELDYQNSQGYKGQLDNSIPRLENLSDFMINDYQINALQEYIPGRIQQLNFVKETQPKVVTMTGGGNDVGFGSVILNCIATINRTCDYARTNIGKAILGQSINNQYYRLVDLYTEIKKVSPQTKIYAIGYPRFVADQAIFCAPNVQLDRAERTMINESVSYLNQIIKDAANQAGVKYVDIENSLVGHRLCESGESYVTGVAMYMDSEKQESYHPNKNGHIKIANAVRSALGSVSLIDFNHYPATPSNPAFDDTPPDPTSYFSAAMQAAERSYRQSNIVKRNYVQKNNSTAIFNIQADGFKPSSSVHVEIHSDPIDLGEYITDSNGRLSVDLGVNQHIKAGFHTLHVVGEANNGEHIDLWQHIEVRGVDGDVDEDGIDDVNDKCMYIASISRDIDYDGIDDACDPFYENGKSDAINGMTTDTSSRSNIDKIAVKLTNTRSVDSAPIESTLFRISNNDVLAYQFNTPITSYLKENEKEQRYNTNLFAGFALIVVISLSYYALKHYSNRIG